MKQEKQGNSMEQIADSLTEIFRKIEQGELKKTELIFFLQSLDPSMRSLFLEVTDKLKLLPYAARFQVLDANTELMQQEREQVESRRKN